MLTKTLSVYSWTILCVSRPADYGSFIMPPSILVSGSTIAAAALAVLVSGCAMTTTRSATADTATTTTPAVGGTVGFTDYTDNDGPNSTVILTGAIGDFGGAVSVHPDGTVDPDHRSQLKLALRDGSFRIGIADLDKKFVGAMRTFPPNTSTCSGTVTVAATARIVAGSGTGSYRRISGAFDLTLTLAEVDAKTKCTTSSALLKESIVTAGTGTVSVR